MAEALYSRAIDLLAQERTILISGQFEKLAHVTQRKSELLSELKISDKLTQTELKSIDDTLKKNQILIQSSLNGISAGRMRLAEFRHVRECLSFYGPHGKRNDVVTSQAKSLKRKA